jgi:hypothetical protein
MRTEALNARSLPAVAHVDSGSAYDGDRVRLCDCNHEGYGPVRSIQVYVNRQRGYPAMAMAEVELAPPDATAYPQRAYLATRRDSRSQPWRIAWTTQKDDRLAEHRNGHVQANGLVGRYRFWTDSRDPVYMTRFARGETFAGGLIHRSVLETAPRGGHLVQDVDRGAQGPQVAPGSYRSLAVDGVSQTCFVQAFPGPVLLIRVSGGNEENESTVVARR